MLPANAPAPQSTTRPDSQPVRCGVGLDTSRYGHYAAFLGDDRQPAVAELGVAESANGDAQFRQRLEQLAGRHAAVHFVIRLDAAGQYADNLLHFLHQLGTASSQQTPTIPNAHFTLSGGDLQRNKNSRAALFGSQKSDPVEARAAARFALRERPTPTPPLAIERRGRRQVAGRLQATVRQRTRLRNQFHHLLALTFPERALLIKDSARGWVLEFIHRYPTAQLRAAVTPKDLGNIPYFPNQHIEPLLEHARSSIASLSGATAAELVRDQVRQLRDGHARHKRLENRLLGADRDWPNANHLDSSGGSGAVTAAVLTAFILDIDRFETPHKRGAYFGVLPIKRGSGIDRDGPPRGPRRSVMSKRGNDRVRRYLWLAALSASRGPPAVRTLYRRVVAKQPQRKAVAVGHALRKLLQLVFAVWKSDKPFHPQHYPWEQPARAAASDNALSVDGDQTPTSDNALSMTEQAAGHKPEQEPARTGVTAAWESTLAAAEPVGANTFLDFEHLKQQVPIAKILDHLGLSSRRRGRGSQRRGPCPLPRGDGRGRTFSVNLAENVFCCHAKGCGQQGDVIDLWAALHHQSLRAAALELVQTFDLEPTPATEKRNG